jgi:hypothetical protein
VTLPGIGVAVGVAVRVGGEVGTEVGLGAAAQVGQGSHAANVSSRAAAAHPATSAAMKPRPTQTPSRRSYWSRQVMAPAVFSVVSMRRTSPRASSTTSASGQPLARIM